MGKEARTKTTTTQAVVANTISKPADAAETKLGGNVKKPQAEGGAGKGNKDNDVKTEELAKLTYGVQSFGQ